MLNLVTGSSGFIGTNIVQFLLSKGESVIAIDNFCSSEKWKSKIFHNDKNYEFIEFDINNPLEEIINKSRLFKQYNRINKIYNMACPASPPRYQKLALETIKVCTTGVENILEIAKKNNSKVLHASTSEIYGDPLVHPQSENYRGNVNTVGPRSCYDEGKRISETICYEYKQKYDLDIKLVRIFNTYGPFMDPLDGRVITNFVTQALKNESITIYGDGSQTRSFQYIDDLINGFELFTNSEKEFFGPVNMGNPDEFTIKELSEIVVELINTKSKIEYKNLPIDDPKQRKPDITIAQQKLDWSPRVKLKEGLIKTIEYYKNYYERQN